MPYPVDYVIANRHGVEDDEIFHERLVDYQANIIRTELQRALARMQRAMPHHYDDVVEHIPYVLEHLLNG